MLAFLLALALLGFWFALGLASLALVARRHVLQNMLLAPAVGLSIIVVCTYVLNYSGLPVGSFARPLAFGLFFGAVIVFWRLRRPVISIRSYLPFFGVLSLAMAVTGWPLLVYGFEWLALGNNDMVITSYGAQYFLTRGFLQGPDLAAIAHDTDYSQYIWPLYVVGFSRVGDALLVAWVAGTAQLRPDEIYMPMAMALHLSLISAAGALALRAQQSLALRARELRLAAFFSCLLIAMSAVPTYAVVNELISQIGGLCLLAASMALILRGDSSSSIVTAGLRALPAGVVSSAMMLYCPEMTPFLGLGVLVYLAIGRLRGEFTRRSLYVTLGLLAVVVLLALNTRLLAMPQYLLHAAGGAGGAIAAAHQGSAEVAAKLRDSLFPYYYIPAGLATLWGFLPYTKLFPDPWSSIAIAAGALLLLLTCAATIWQAGRRLPVAILALIMLILAAALFTRGGDFGLFKLAMYVQPFLLATLAIAWLCLAKDWWRGLPILLIGCAGLPTLMLYVTQSTPAARAAEAAGPSAAHIKQQFEQALRSAPIAIPLAVDVPVAFLSGLEGLIAQGRPVVFSSLVAERALQVSITEREIGIWEKINPGVVETYQKFLTAFEAKLKSDFLTSSFDLKDPAHPDAANGFRVQKNPAEAWSLDGSFAQTIFNRRHEREAEAPVPIHQAADHLIFLDSDLGSQHYSFGAVAFSPLEGDFFYPGGVMSALGRYFLFRVDNPSPQVRMALSVTASLMADGENRLPPAAVIGAERKSFPLIGRGSARVFSPPLEPQDIDGMHFFGLDLETDGKRFPIHRTGLMRLYGMDIPSDRRKVVAFGRDISLLSDAEYRALAPPSAVESFPAGLADKALEYSGIYEDGWVAEGAFLSLKLEGANLVLRLEGSVPKIDDPNFSTQLIVLVDNREVGSKTLRLGAFSFEFPLSPSAGARRIDLKLSRVQHLSVGDNRLVAAQLKYVGLQRSESGVTQLNNQP